MKTPTDKEYLDALNAFTLKWSKGTFGSEVYRELARENVTLANLAIASVLGKYADSLEPIMVSLQRPHNSNNDYERGEALKVVIRQLRERIQSGVVTLVTGDEATTEEVDSVLDSINKSSKRSD